MTDDETHIVDDDAEQIDALAEEFLARCRRGEDPSVSEYAARYPQWSAAIRESFPVIAAVEHSKRGDGPGEPSSANVPDGLPLERLGDFRIVREIGRGGMGVVYEAEQESLGRRVAIKILPNQFVGDATRRKRFEREARMAARLHHTNIVPIFGVGQHGGNHYYVMQRIHGVGLDAIFRTLLDRPAAIVGSTDEFAELTRAILSRGSAGSMHADASLDAGAPSSTTATAHVSGPNGADRLGDSAMSGTRREPSYSANGRVLHPRYWQSVARLLAQAADALAFAHSQGVLHRDVKPANLLLDERGTIWVADFGLATVLDPAERSQAGDFAGTLRYMAPERFSGAGDERSDVYALGVTLFELATLETAFSGYGGRSVIRAVLEKPLPSPRSLCPAMPRDLETILLKATAREPDQRYATAAVLRDDLRRFADDLPIQARRISATERLLRWARRNPALSTSLALVFVLLAAIATVASIAYFRVSRAERGLATALVGQTTQRERAESTLQVAEAALDRVFDSFAPQSALGASVTTDDEQEVALESRRELVVSPEAAELLTSMLDYYQRLADQEGGSRALLRKTAAAHARMGVIYDRLGRLDEAQAALNESISRFGRLIELAPEDVAARVMSADTQNRLAQVLVHAGKWRETSAPLQTALQTLNEVTGRADVSDDAWFTLAQTHYLMSARRPPLPMMPPPGEGPRRPASAPASRSTRDPGDGPQRRSEWFASMRDHRDKAIAILNRLAEKSTVPGYRQWLARCLRDDFNRGTSTQPTVDVNLPRAIQILERLVEEFPNVPEYRFDLAESYAMQGFGPEAAGGLQRSVEILDALLRDSPAMPEYTASLAQVLFRQARGYDEAGRVEDAAAAIVRAASLQDELSARFPNVRAYVERSANLSLRAARMLERYDRLEAARDFLERAVRRLAALPPQETDSSPIQALRVSCYRQLAMVYTALGDEDAAEEANEQRDALQNAAGDPARD